MTFEKLFAIACHRRDDLAGETGDGDHSTEWKLMMDEKINAIIKTGRRVDGKVICHRCGYEMTRRYGIDSLPLGIWHFEEINHSEKFACKTWVDEWLHWSSIRSVTSSGISAAIGWNGAKSIHSFNLHSMRKIASLRSSINWTGHIVHDLSSICSRHQNVFEISSSERILEQSLIRVERICWIFR